VSRGTEGQTRVSGYMVITLLWENYNPVTLTSWFNSVPVTRHGSELGCRTYAEAMARNGDTYHVDARPITLPSFT
jgi:hypothetical protein